MTSQNMDGCVVADLRRDSICKPSTFFETWCSLVLDLCRAISAAVLRVFLGEELKRRDAGIPDKSEQNILQARAPLNVFLEQPDFVAREPSTEIKSIQLWPLFLQRVHEFTWSETGLLLANATMSGAPCSDQAHLQPSSDCQIFASDNESYIRFVPKIFQNCLVFFVSTLCESMRGESDHPKKRRPSAVVGQDFFLAHRESHPSHRPAPNFSAAFTATRVFAAFQHLSR